MPAGRPSDYDPQYHPEKAHKLALLMATDEEVADFFGISHVTLNAWKARHPEFLSSITRGKLIADAEVADKLRHRAMGYSHEAVKIFMPAGANEPVYAQYTEHYPPDTQAASLWLRNRQRGRWRDQQDHEHNHHHEVDPGNLAYDQLMALAQTKGVLTIEHEAAPPPDGEPDAQPPDE